MEIISACIESGCYSAVFAIMLAFAVRTHIRRERYYRSLINELAAGLCDLDRVNVRLDEICSGMAGVKKHETERREDVCAFAERKTTAAESS